MKEYLSHLSAAQIWEVPYIECVLGYQIDTDLTHTTISEYSARFHSKGKKVHICELLLPIDAVINRNGKKVASPELLFLEFANELSIHRLILLGLQLCSHKQGKPASALTTKQKITEFLTNTAGHRGHRKAMRAVKYVENGSASIMESLAYMILTLPYALGGYGLNGAAFNHQIDLKSEVRKRIGKSCFYVDLYYEHAKLAVEYDSFAHHSSPAEQGKDRLRSAILERQGINVMHMSTIQLYSSADCKDFAHNLAARLGKRIQIHTNKFNEMHSFLRALLPERKPDEKPDD